LKNKNTSLEKEVLFLKDNENEREKEKRKNNIEIHGIPKVNNEDLPEVIINVAKKLDIKLNKDNIVKCFRIRAFNSEKVKNDKHNEPILVSLNQFSLKEAFMKKRKSKCFSNEIIKDASIVSRLYINENLTPTNRLLFKEVRNFRKQHDYKFLWTNSGNILIRKTEDSKVIYIKNFETLNSLKNSL
jgi:hypothetical protein